MTVRRHDISIAAALADPGPQEDQGYDHEDATLVSLWANVQTKLGEYNDVSSHSTEGTSYSRDLSRAEKTLLDYYQAYLLRRDLLCAADSAHPLHLRTSRSRTTDWSGIALQDL